MGANAKYCLPWYEDKRGDRFTYAEAKKERRWSIVWKTAGQIAKKVEKEMDANNNAMLKTTSVRGFKCTRIKSAPGIFASGV